MAHEKSPFDGALIEAQKVALETLYIPPALRNLYQVIKTSKGLKLVNVETRD